jgi:hypothetical protein
MRESTRRFYCRLGFVLGCVVPTIAVLAWLLILRTPWYLAREQQAWNEALSQRLGIPVTVDAVSRPDRGLVRLTNFVLADPETGDPQVIARTVDIARQGAGWIVYVPGAEAKGASLARLWDVLQRNLLERAGVTTDGGCQLLIDSLNFVSNDGGQTLQDVQATWERRVGGPRLIIDFRLAGWAMNSPARVLAVRNRQTTPPTTAWDFDTGPQALPASLLSLFVPRFAELGSEALVEGHLTLNHNAHGWDGRGKAICTQVDLDRLIAGRFPHKLTGMAQLEFTQIEWQQSRLAQLTGTFRAQDGVVSQSLLFAAATPEGLNATLPERVLESNQPLWRYRELGLQFDLNDQGLRLAGICSEMPPGALLADQRGPLAFESKEELVAVAGVIRTLAPQNELQVPASLQTEQLLQWLPLPQLVPAPAEVARPRYAPLRLK